MEGSGQVGSQPPVMGDRRKIGGCKLVTFWGNWLLAVSGDSGSVNCGGKLLLHTMASMLRGSKL